MRVITLATTLLIIAAFSCTTPTTEDRIDWCDDPDTMYACVDDATGDICEDPEAPGCSCPCEPSDPDPPSNDNNVACSTDLDCPSQDICLAGICEAYVEPAYRYVLLEDLVTGTAGDFPGVDIDSVALLKSGGTVVDAISVEDSLIGPGVANQATDASQVLGPQDAYCDASSGRFYSMGGATGYLVLGFGDAIIENGDSIDVVTLGSIECGIGGQDHLGIAVGLSNHIDDSWLEIATCSGSCIVAISGL